MCRSWKLLDYTLGLRPRGGGEGVPECGDNVAVSSEERNLRKTGESCRRVGGWGETLCGYDVGLDESWVCLDRSVLARRQSGRKT